MLVRLLALLCTLGPFSALACSPCRAYVQAGIFDGSFTVKLLVMTAPVVVLIAGAFALYYLGKKKE